MKKRSLIMAAIMLLTVLSQPASAAFDRQFYINNNILFYDGTVCSESINNGAVILAGNDNEQKILNFFMQKGLSLAAASGFIGNMRQESGLDPRKIEGGSIADENYKPVNGRGFGLVQWTFTARQQPLIEHTKSLGVPVTDLSGQLSFIWEELNGKWLSTLNKLRNVKTAHEAAVLIEKEYEVSADSDAMVVANRARPGRSV